MHTASGIDRACAQLRIGSYVMARVGRKFSRAMGLSGNDAFVRSTGQRIARILSQGFGRCLDKTRHESPVSRLPGRNHRLSAGSSALGVGTLPTSTQLNQRTEVLYGTRRLQSGDGNAPLSRIA